MTEQPTLQPTNLDINPTWDIGLTNYYSLRVTVPESSFPQLQEILNKYSKNYCAASHVPDSGCNRHHYHILFLDMDRKKTEAMRKKLKEVFASEGNGFYAGSFRDNHLYNGLKYVKHDSNARFYHRGSSWQKYIDESPQWVSAEDFAKSATKKRKRPDTTPTLSFSNLMALTLSHREKNKIDSTHFDDVMEHMMINTDYIPSRELRVKGVDPYFKKIFQYKATSVGKRGPYPKWWADRDL